MTEKEKPVSKIENDQEYYAILTWLDNQFDLKISPKSAEGEKIQSALLRIKEYEDVNYPIK